MFRSCHEGFGPVLTGGACHAHWPVEAHWPDAIAIPGCPCGGGHRRTDVHRPKWCLYGTLDPGGQAEPPVVLLAVGDIACDPTSPYIHSPGLCEQKRVGRLVHKQIEAGADWFVPLGDLQYETASYSAYQKVYDHAFGQVRKWTRPVPGNHEYLTPHARGYFRYFKKRAGSPKRPWQSFVAAPGWRVLLLNSNCEFIGGCGPGSPEGRWIRKALARSKQECVIAAWHHPLQTSGEYAGNVDTMSRARKLWRPFNAGGGDIVLNGHDHIYERFAKRSDVQQFTVGTGGKNHYDITTKAPGSKKRIDNRYGVLRLELSPDGTYKYEFMAVSGRVLDAGFESCTNQPHH